MKFRPEATGRSLVPPVTLLAALLVVSCGWGAPDQDYVLGAGDVIAIAVFDHPELSMMGVQIRPDGKIAHPFLGELMVAGATPKELAATVAKGLTGEIKDPIVTVNVTGFRENRLYVLGEVKTPGTFPADTPLTVAKAIALAGDITEKADRQKATLIPKNGEPRTINLQEALQAADGPAHVLKAGDTLIVLPKRMPSIIVWGEVGEPGKLELPEGQNTVLNAIAAAKGLTSRADRREATIVHPDGKTEKVDLTALLDDHNLNADRILQDGDMLTVAPHRNEVMVLGAVSKAGPVDIIPGDRLSDVMGLVGGLPETADMQNVRIVRDGETVLIVNVGAILKDYNMAANIEVKPGDTIFVPEIRWQVLVFGAVGSAGGYAIKPGDRLLDVLAKVGGFMKDKTSPNKAALVRVVGQEAQVYLVDVNALIKGQQLDKNFELQDRDVIIVPAKTGLDWRELVGELFQAVTLIRLFQ